jgi:CDP-glucose 4,6-dehydratase
LSAAASFWRERRVLATGHTGFKGGWLSLWLWRAGAEVVGYSNGVPTQPSLYEAARVDEVTRSIIGDVRDLRDLKRAFADHRPEVVFHLAAQPLVRASYADPVTTYETNVLGTANVLEAIRRTKSVRAAVIVTTDKVYEPVPGRAHREDDRLGGEDPYSSSKACAELVTAAYRASFFADEGAPAVATARAGNVIGGGDWARDRLIPDVVNALARDDDVEIRYPHAVRPWQHVLNPTEGYLLLAEALWQDRAAGRAWNFGPGPEDARSVEWVAKRAAELWGMSLRIVSPSSAQPAESESLELDASLARTELGWHPRWALDRGLEATIGWYRDHAAGEDARALTLAQIDEFVTGDSRVPVGR